MRRKKENKNSPIPTLHQAVLQIDAPDARRWTAAVWAISAPERDLIAAIKALIESTLVVEWIQPSGEGGEAPRGFASFDLVFYEAPKEGSELVQFFQEGGWKRIEGSALGEEELKRLSVFQNEARRESLEIAEAPEALYRLDVERMGGELGARLEDAARRAGRHLKGEVWGEKPGLFSKVFSDALRGSVQMNITPNQAGLALLEDLIAEEGKGIYWLDPLVFQALCDFLGVVLQARGDREVQWSLCAPEKETGLAPPPLLRIRKRGEPWKVVNLGLGVVQALASPWRAGGSRPLAALLGEYE